MIAERWRSAACSAGAMAVLALFVVAVHAPADRADFTLDDYDYVGSNQSIRSFATAFAAFAQPLPPQHPEKSLYRPLTNLTYAVDFALWRDRAWGYHATNVAVYAAVVWLVFALGVAYTHSPLFAFALALAFAAHPIHCEAVDSITGRSEMLALGFALASLLAFLHALRRAAGAEPRRAIARAGPALGASALAYALAALAKETGAVVPAILAVHFLVYGRRPGEPAARWVQRGAALLVPHAIVAAGYLAARAHALPAFLPERAGVSWMHRVFSIGLVFFQDVRLLVWPVPSRVDFYWERLFLHPRESALRFALGMALLGFALRTFADWTRAQIRTPDASKAREVALCALAVFLAFWFPVSQIVPIGVTMAERLLFAPSLGFCLLAVIAAREALRRRVAHPRARAGIAALLVALIAGAGGVRSRERALDWRDAVRLWTAEDRALPGDPRILANLALAYLERARWEEAADALDRARHAPTRVEGLAPVLDEIEALLRSRRRAP